MVGKAFARAFPDGGSYGRASRFVMVTSSSPRICEADQEDNSDVATGSSAWEQIVPEVKVGRFGGMSFVAPPYKVCSAFPNSDA